MTFREPRNPLDPGLLPDTKYRLRLSISQYAVNLQLLPLPWCGRTFRLPWTEAQNHRGPASPPRKVFCALSQKWPQTPLLREVFTSRLPTQKRCQIPEVSVPHLWVSAT